MCYVFSMHKEQADVFHLHDFLILDLREKKKKKERKKKPSRMKKSSVCGSCAYPHVQVCACIRSLEPKPVASPFLRLLDALEKRLLGLQWVTLPEHRSWRSCTPWEQKTCLGGYSDPKHWDDHAQTQDSMQVSFLPYKPFFIPWLLASLQFLHCPLTLMSLQLLLSFFLRTHAMLFCITWWLR